MKKILMVVGFVVVMFILFVVNVVDYVIDIKGVYVLINFKVNYLGYSYIKGCFNKFDGEFFYDFVNIVVLSVVVNVDICSLDLNYVECDKYICSVDFIDVLKYLIVIFKSIEVVDKGNG